MKNVPDAVLADLAGRFGYDPAALTWLGGGRESSDGITWRTGAHGERVFKIIGTSAGKEHPDAATKVRAAFFAYLGKNGLEVVAPEENAAGNLTEYAEDGKSGYIAYTYRFLSGQHPDPKTWDADLVRAWGRVIGKAHALSKGYEIWQGFEVPGRDAPIMHWRSEVESFAEWAQGDAELQGWWHALGARLAKLPQTRDTMGFIHNDPHMQNIVFEDGKAKLLDFDVATCHFYACDLAIAIQSVLFTQGGGMERPVSDQAAIDRFVGWLLEGYAQENTLTPDITGSLELFIAYRRVLLYTVMQDGLKARPAAREAWRQMILKEPQILRLG